jgi:peptide/nickel transport system substrate-binding protein
MNTRSTPSRLATTLGRRTVLAAAPTAALALQAASALSFAKVAFGRGEGGTFVYARAGDPDNLDPALQAPDTIATQQIFEGLVSFDGATTQIKPLLARSWEASADGLTYTFNLRRGVRFHDGTPFDADAVKWNFDRWMDESNPYHKGDFQYWTYVAGFNEAVKSVDVVDPTTVQISLNRPQGPFLLNLALFAFSMSSPSALMADYDRALKNPIGTGAFRFAERVPGDRVVLDRNPDYWSEPANLDRVVIRTLPDNGARFLALRGGSVDMIEGPNPEDVVSARRDRGLSVVLRPPLNVGYVGFNLNAKPFDNLRVRQAVAAALNRTAIVEALYGSTATVASQLLPPGMLGFNTDVKGPSYDPDRAKRLLGEAGLGSGFSTQLWYMPVNRPYMPDSRAIGEAMASDLGKVGIKVELKTEDWGTFLTGRTQGKYPMYQLGWIGDNGDPDNFLFPFFGNFSGENTWDNDQVRTLLRQAQSSVDSIERDDLYRQVNGLVDAELPRVPLAHNSTPLIARSYVKGFIANPTAQEFYSSVWLDK